MVNDDPKLQNDGHDELKEKALHGCASSTPLVSQGRSHFPGHGR